MRRISIVCTCHDEYGKCNMDELHKILCAIKPEVFFEEIRQSDFNAFYKEKSLTSMETLTIAKYLEANHAQQVPVDDVERPESFGRDAFAISDFVVANSDEYKELDNVKNRDEFQYGFEYINSPTFSKLLRKLAEISEETIEKKGDDYLKQSLVVWNEINHKREIAMVNNIYAFCRNHEFNRGVFLVGAAHRNSILTEIEGYIKNEPNLIDWHQRRMNMAI